MCVCVRACRTMWTWTTCAPIGPTAWRSRLCPSGDRLRSKALEPSFTSAHDTVRPPTLAVHLAVFKHLRTPRGFMHSLNLSSQLQKHKFYWNVAWSYINTLIILNVRPSQSSFFFFFFHLHCCLSMVIHFFFSRCNDSTGWFHLTKFHFSFKPWPQGPPQGTLWMWERHSTRTGSCRSMFTGRKPWVREGKCKRTALARDSLSATISPARNNIWNLPVE